MHDYDHTQKGPWQLFLFALAAMQFSLMWLCRNEPVAILILSATGMVFFVIGLMFGELTVADRQDHLLLSFGPWTLLKKKISYDEIDHVVIGRTTFLDSWGIHMSFGGGWVWNIWGFDCVVVHTKRTKIKIGTDEPQRLAEFLHKRLGVEGEAD